MMSFKFNFSNELLNDRKVDFIRLRQVCHFCAGLILSSHGEGGRSSPRCPKGHRMKRSALPAGPRSRHREGRSGLPAGLTFRHREARSDIRFFVTARDEAVSVSSSSRAQAKRSPRWHAGRLPHRFALQTILHVLMVITAKWFAMTNQASPRCPKGHRMKRSGLPAGLTFRHRECYDFVKVILRRAGLTEQ